MSEIIVLPGIGGSGDAHWQTLWERKHANLRRFEPASWDEPRLQDWLAALDRAIEACDERPVLVAHSLSCLLIANWQLASEKRIAGAFLVAAPDPSGDHFPEAAAEFTGVPDVRFAFPALMIASSDDPYGSMKYARARAAQWGAGLVELGNLGHINGASNLGEWQEGWHLLTAFVAGCAYPPHS